MNIYEIDKAILNLVDADSGEITDYEQLDKLTMERDTKLENVALWIKNLAADANAIREEEKHLAERRKAAEDKAEGLQKYLDRALMGASFTTAKVAITYRKSTAVDIANEERFIQCADAAYLRPQPPKIDRKAISDALKSGKEVDGAKLVERNNMQIK